MRARRLSTARNVISSDKCSGYAAIIERAGQILHNLSYEDQRIRVLQLHAGGDNEGSVIY
jgi:hypothetical protein